MIEKKKDWLKEVSLKIEFIKEIQLNQKIADENFKPILEERFPEASLEKKLSKN